MLPNIFKQNVCWGAGLICFLWLAAPHAFSTTFVVLEGGKEVGRYESPDGKNEVEYIHTDKPAPRMEEAVPDPGMSKSDGVSYSNVDELYQLLQAKPPVVSRDRSPNNSLILYLRSQPWFQELRLWDEKHGVADKLVRHRKEILVSIAILGVLLVLYRLYRIFRAVVLFFRWLFRPRKKKDEAVLHE